VGANAQKETTLMKNTRTLLFSATALPAAMFLFAAPAGEISFSPAEGHSVTRSWTAGSQFSLDDMEMSMNGQPMPMDMEMEMDMDMTMSFEVTDTFVGMMDGQPSELHRSFDVLDSNGSFSVEAELMPGGGEEKTIEASSELEGKTVAFKWNEENGEYDVDYHESEGESELLEGLTEDMDFRALLPAGSVDEDESWDIDVKQLTAILAPGGDMGLVPEMDEEEMGMMPGMQDFGRGMNDMLGDLLEGEANGTFKGYQEVDGVRVAVIALTVSIESSNDMTEKVAEAMGELPIEAELDIDYMDIEVSIEGEGTLHWDVEGGHVHSYDMSGSMGFITDMGMTMTMGDQDMEMEQTFEMSGTFENSMAISVN